MTVGKDLTVEDLLQMSRREHWEVMKRAHPFDPAALDDTQYIGVDLSLPRVMNRLLWKTFRKTFHRDPATGVLRGWNVRLEQTGWEVPTTPMTDRHGEPITFGHYEVRAASGKRFPWGWQGAHYLDYGVAGNVPLDPARVGYCPVVAVNAGRHDLLLGWEVLKVGPALIPLPDYWALVREGPLDRVVPVPRPTRTHRAAAVAR